MPAVDDFKMKPNFINVEVFILNSITIVNCINKFSKPKTLCTHDLTHLI